MEKQKYITNKDLLAEIHRCKSTFCSFIEDQYAAYDAIVENIDDITPELIRKVREAKSIKLTPKGEPPVPVPEDGLVFRVMTYDHIPLDPDRKRKTRAANQTHAKTNFAPFKHYLLQDGELKEVGRSHWEGGFENGHFTTEKGRLTPRLGYMMKVMVENLGRRSNWRGYTYNEDMQSHALVQLSQVALLFDESKSENPFAFYTTVITNCFRRVLIVEKKAQELRDDLLMQAGATPSFARQIENELAQKAEYQAPKRLPAKRGRKPAAVKAAMEKEAAREEPKA